MSSEGGQTSSKNNIYKKNTTEHDAEARDHMITLPPFGVFTSCLKLNANAIHFEMHSIYVTLFNKTSIYTWYKKLSYGR